MTRSIGELNEGLVLFKECIADDEVAAARTELAVVAYNAESRLEHDFATAPNFEPPILRAGGGTKISSGINQALDLVEERKMVYRANGITYYVPWVWLLCDGYPQHDTPEEWEMAKERVKRVEGDRQVSFFVVGVGDEADMRELNTIGDREALKLNGLNFKGMFQWLSSSMGSMSRSLTDDDVPLDDPTTGAHGWATASGR